MNAQRTPRHLATLILAAGLLSIGSQASAADSKASPSKNPKKDAKVGTYVGIINAWSNYIFDGRASYAKWVTDMKTGPTCKESGLRGPSATGDSAPATYAHYRADLLKKPKLEADDAALQMVEALEQLRLPVQEASTYYYEGKYRKDDCKRGKELHPILLAGWAKYAQADEAVRTFVEKYNDEREAADLADVEKKYGKGLRFYHRKLGIEGKVLIRFVEAQLAAAPKPDTAAIRAKLTGFDEVLTSATALVAKEKKGKNADALYQGGYEQLLTTAGWYKDAVIELMRKLDGETAAPANAANAANARGARPELAKAVIDAYNNMVEQSNKVMYSHAMK